MGVTIGGVRHEELADPGGGSYASAADYNAAAGPASQQGGQNLNWGQGSSSGGGGGAAAVGGAGGAQQYGSAIQSMLEAIASGNKQAFDRAVLEADRAFQLDRDKFAQDVSQFNQTFGITQSGVTGTYQGAPTLPALTSYATQFGQWGVPQQGAQTLAAQQQAYAQQLGAITTAAGLQANPFRQQQVVGQLGGLLGGQGVAGFQAPNVVQGVGTAGGNTRGGMGYLSQLIADIKDPTPNQTSMNDVLGAIPTPNKLNSVEFQRAAPSTQSMVLQGMQEKFGLDPADSLRQIQSTLPQFQAPSTLGGIRR